jgi:hypothetical protein
MLTYNERSNILFAASSTATVEVGADKQQHLTH